MRDKIPIAEPEMPWAKNMYWLYPILVKKALRDKIIEHLEKRGIETRPFFYPIHTLPPYNSSLKLPIAEELSAMGLSLLSGPRLLENQIKEIVKSLKEGFEKLNLHLHTKTRMRGISY